MVTELGDFAAGNHSTLVQVRERLEWASSVEIPDPLLIGPRFRQLAEFLQLFPAWPEAREALDEWLRVKDDLYAGHDPRPKVLPKVATDARTGKVKYASAPQVKIARKTI